jgi:hypothetical protein
LDIGGRIIKLMYFLSALKIWSTAMKRLTKISPNNALKVYFIVLNSGYIGSLCETCDFLGEVWQETYYKLEKYECSKC